MDWINLAMDRGRWRAGGVQVTGTCERSNWSWGFDKIRGTSWLADELFASQEGLCSMELSN